MNGGLILIKSAFGDATLASESILSSESVRGRYWEIMVMGGSVTMFLTGPVYFAVAKLYVHKNIVFEPISCF